MKIGYPCLNWSLSCQANHTFRLKNYSEERLIDAVDQNLDCLEKILHYNIEHGFKFFRISSDTIPFASHPVCEFKWQNHYEKRLSVIGELIRENDIRISVHPDQFTLLNSPDESVFGRSVKELQYHADLLDLMGLDDTAKIQMHVGGIYNERMLAIERFINRYEMISQSIKDRLAIENDDRLYSLNDCINIHECIDIPVIFDTFHHSLLNNQESLIDALKSASRTWT